MIFNSKIIHSTLFVLTVLSTWIPAIHGVDVELSRCQQRTAELAEQAFTEHENEVTTDTSSLILPEDVLRTLLFRLTEVSSEHYEKITEARNSVCIPPTQAKNIYRRIFLSSQVFTNLVWFFRRTYEGKALAVFSALNAMALFQPEIGRWLGLTPRVYFALLPPTLLTISWMFTSLKRWGDEIGLHTNIQTEELQKIRRTSYDSYDLAYYSVLHACFANKQAWTICNQQDAFSWLRWAKTWRINRIERVCHDVFAEDWDYVIQEQQDRKIFSVQWDQMDPWITLEEWKQLDKTMKSSLTQENEADKTVKKWKWMDPTVRNACMFRLIAYGIDSKILDPVSPEEKKAEMDALQAEIDKMRAELSLGKLDNGELP